MDRHRARLRRPGLACRERIGVAFADNRHLCAAGADAGELGRRGHVRHEDLRRDSQLARRIGDGRTMVAARCGDDASRRHLAQQQIGEGTPCLERPRVLEKFHLDVHRPAGKPEIGKIDGHDRRRPDVGPDSSLDARDPITTDRFARHSQSRAPLRSAREDRSGTLLPVRLCGLGPHGQFDDEIILLDRDRKRLGDVGSLDQIGTATRPSPRTAAPAPTCGSHHDCPVRMSNSQPCHGQRRNSRSRVRRYLPGPSDRTSGPITPRHSGPPACGQRFASAKYSPPS